ncbi:hypothetical protein [Fusobacterium hwasookii]|uniref:Phage tail tape measure protein n=1 Tax=Fusobacterium hwasookii ChDC F206 TaxID=1307443 RepID=A0AAC9F191_9FUSO|nr:hypothetical protein [Fusobacterium hwasookii]ALQ36202.1 hypothetical protein RN92_09875 [Fusobacterium hwasookii ChDC F206]
MLEQLSLVFKVVGNGQVTLNQISSQIGNLKNNMSNFKNSVSSTFGNLKSTIGSVKQSLVAFKNKISTTFNALKAKITANFPAISKLRNGFISLRRGLGNFGNYAQQQFQKSKEKASTLLSVLKRIATTLAAGFTLKTAIEGAGNIEQYRNTLETVLKDPNMARKKLAWASRFANKTPFETDEVVGGMTKLQSYGIEGDRVLKTTNRTYLEMIGDMASGMGKSFDQAIEAIADARTGELERLKEFGITKNMIAEFGKSKGLEIFNNKGQINDLELFNKTLFEMMDSRFGGAMEKQAKTFKGGLSTISGATKSALATLAGVNEFGDIVENSPFQILRDRVIIPLANTLVKFQEDGTFTRWAENLSNVFGELISWGEKIINFIVKWKEILIPLASAIAGLFVINKVIVLIGALKTALAALSFNPIMLAIGAVIAIGVLLYRNWDLIKEKLISLWDKIKGFVKVFLFFSGIGLIIKLGQLLIENWEKIKAKLSSLWDKIKAFAKALWDIGKKIFMWLSPIGLIITVGKLIIENWDLIKAKFAELGSYLYNKIIDIGNFFIGLKDKVVDVFFNLIDKLKEVWETMKSTAASAFDFILDYVAKIWESIKGFFSGLGEKIKSLPGISWFFSDSEKKNTNSPMIDGTHKTGLNYVPFDGYIAELHKGERVLTAEENNAYSSSETNEFSNTSNSANTKNSNKSDKKIILNLTVNMSGTKEMDWNRIGEMIVEKLEDLMLQNDIAKGEI